MAVQRKIKNLRLTFLKLVANFILSFSISLLLSLCYSGFIMIDTGMYSMSDTCLIADFC